MLQTGWRCALLCVFLLEHSSAQDVVVTWKGRGLPLDELVTDNPKAAALAKGWAKFVSERSYRLVLSNNRRVLLVLSSTFRRRKSKKEHHDVDVFLDLVDKTCSVADRFLAPHDASAAPLVIVCTKQRDYGHLLDHVSSRHEKLKAWASRAARNVAGFILSDPLLAAWIEDPEGVTEWHPYNELVHRTAQLLIRRQTPHMPEWLLLGLAWHTEDAVRRSVYCFPHRTGFVSAAEHTDWGLWLANNFKKRRRKKQQRPPALQISEFADWRPRKDVGFATGRAYVSFGVARYLAREHPARLQELQKKLNEAIVKGRKVWVSDTKWRTRPDFRVAVDKQLQLLEQVEEDFLAAVTHYFRKRKAIYRSRPKRRKR